MRLLGSPRNFPELPQKWDGAEVAWGPWGKKIRVSHVDQSCGDCGLSSSLWASTGWYRHHSAQNEWQRRGRTNFHATRCGWCGDTTVHTLHDKQSWELDESDYTEHGSYDKDEMETLF